MTLNTMVMRCSVLVVMMTLVVSSQAQQYTTPVPILKQINRHNEDGSYSYGYEGADGSFKIETKYANGEVYGKYGYVDDSGKTREVEYGATKRGFEPQGSDINVPPPTLTNSNPYPLGPNEVDDGQYREDPSVYYKDNKYSSAPRPATNFRLNNLQPQQPQQYNPVPKTNQYYNPEPIYRAQPAPVQPAQHRFQQQPAYYQPQPQPQAQIQPQPQQQQYYQQEPRRNYNTNYNNNYNNQGNAPIQHHPALRNFDLGSGSYSIDYTGRKR